jgi:hypothetical protein
MRKLNTFLLLIIMLVSGCSSSEAIPLPPTVTPTMPPFSASVTEAPLPEATPAGPNSPEDDECENPFYPVSDEATWTYNISSGITAIHTMAVDDNDAFTIIIQGGDSTFTVDGQCSDEGIILMDTAGAATTYSGAEGSSIVSTIDVSGVTLPKDVGQGAQWSQTIHVTTGDNKSTIESNYTAVGFENITVPAGDFYVLKVEQSGYVTVFGQKVNMHGFHWYAEGVGVVKSAMDGAPTAELVSYDIPE